MIAYKNGVNASPAVGGSDFKLKNNVIVPAYSVSSGEDGEEFDDVKKKDRISYYIVQAGDNVAKIAKKFGISQNTIIWENNLNSRGFLKLKQKLTILPVSGVRYTIKKGDTLGKIAKKFSVDQEKIRSFNDLKDDALKIGEKIIIPDGKKIIAKKATVKKTLKKTIYKAPSKKVSRASSSLAKYFIRPSYGRATSPFGRR